MPVSYYTKRALPLAYLPVPKESIWSEKRTFWNQPINQYFGPIGGGTYHISATIHLICLFFHSEPIMLTHSFPVLPHTYIYTYTEFTSLVKPMCSLKLNSIVFFLCLCTVALFRSSWYLVISLSKELWALGGDYLLLSLAHALQHKNFRNVW